MQAISFLGTTQYKQTTYVYGDQDYTTELFAESLPHFFPDLERVLVFVTPTVQQHSNLALLRERLGDMLEPIAIPEGRSEAELWGIFDALIDVVKEGEAVLFDMTNSFRSLPLVVFLAAAYLRVARQVRVHRIVYGAYEARDQETNRSPVFDLTPFVTLLDWLTATDQFIYTGDARYLAHLLQGQGEVRKSAPLRNAGKSLNELSLAMMLCRPLEVMEKAGGVGQALMHAAQDMALWTKPFTLLADLLDREYAARALAGYMEDAPRSLSVQLDLIRWYLGNNQVIQAVTLAREWMVTLVGCRLGKGFCLDIHEREDEIAWGIHELARLKSGRELPGGVSATAIELGRLPEADRVRKAWDKLIGIRNDLDHAGMSEHRAPASSLVARMRKLLPELDALFREMMPELCDQK